MRGVVACILVALVSAGCLAGTAPEAPTPSDSPAQVNPWFGPAVVPGEYVRDSGVSRTLSAGPYPDTTTEVLHIPSFDGTAIELGILRPVVPEGHEVPVILQASPYFGDLTPDRLPALSGHMTTDLVSQGFAAGFMALRGSSDSGACTDLLGQADLGDIDTALTWLAEQDWSNGRIGMIGASWPGAAAWVGAATGNPALHTIVPVAGFPSLSEYIFINGTARGYVDTPLFYYQLGTVYNGAATDRSPDHFAQAVACPTVAPAYAGIAQSAATAEAAQDPFFSARDHRDAIRDNYEGSVLYVNGLQDFNVHTRTTVPWLDQLEASETPVQILVGQWGHAFPDQDIDTDDTRRADFVEHLLRWFRYWLTDDPLGDQGLGPRVQVQDNLGRWRGAQDWPPQDTTPRSLYLGTGAELLDEPSDDERADPITVDGINPAPFDGDACAVQLCLKYTVPERIHVSGLATLSFPFTPAGPAGGLRATLTATLDGETRTLASAFADVRRAHGGEDVQAVVPGQQMHVMLTFGPAEQVLEPDTVLRLRLGSNPLSPVPGGLVHVGGDTARLDLPTIHVQDEVFFTLPWASS